VVDTGGTADLATTSSTRMMLFAGLSTIERLTLVSGNINGTGNTLANIITGSTGANIIKGGRGNDTLSGGRGNDALFGEIGIDRLSGGAGKDNFVFNVAPTLANRDVITDFSHHDDTIKLSHLYFKGMATGPLKSTFFFAGTHAHDGDDHIIYNKATGALYYDSDGIGGHAQVLFAVVANHANAGLAFSDFVLI
jgi:Ca2+-binding RTX toxin-like protein